MVLRSHPSFLIAALGLLLLGTASKVRAQIFKLPRPDTTTGNFFGGAVALDGHRALVGASGENGCGEDAGAAYLFEHDAAGNWQQVAKLTPDDCAEKQFFGRSVALSGDHALVTSFHPFFSAVVSNAAYIFERDSLSGTWHQVAKLTGRAATEEGPFAAAVALDGDRALITASGDPAEGRYGGAAYIYDRDPISGVWKRTARLTGSAGLGAGIFGGSAALDGDRAVVSASTYFQKRPGSLYVFDYDPASGTWHESARLTGIDDFFISVDLDGDRILVGESKGGREASGLATLFERDSTGTWQARATLHPATPYKDGAFGSAVSIKGDRALVVGYDEQLSFEFNIDRVVYVFEYLSETDTWEQLHIIDVGDVAFGASLDLDDGYALIGQASEQHAGLAYVVRIH